jgi:general secretion pathway protein A
MSEFTSHFGFHSIPFTCEVPIEKRFDAEPFSQAVDTLCRTVHRRMCAALIGPAGSGKTVTLRTLRQRLPEARYQVRYLKVTDLSKRDMCREIATVVHARPAGTYPALVRNLQERFASCMNIDGLRPVLIIDEAHDMRPDVLSMIRLLTNFEMDSQLVVSILLAGQPRLRTFLQRDTTADVARRLAHCIPLRPLSREETTRYIQHRITIAGGSCLPFDTGATEALYEISRGNMRAIDLLALSSLEVAWQSGQKVVDATNVTEARRLSIP